MIETKQIAFFFERYQAFTSTWIKVDIAKYGQFILSYGKRVNKIKTELKENAIDYNIFEVLNIKRKETITHTPFLTDLLNPKGRHYQEDLFLRAFIKALLEKHPNYENMVSFDTTEIDVIEEKSTKHGRIDIFIHSKERDNEFVIIIENKIDAEDQYRQLERYWRYARETLQLNEKQIVLIYLNKRVKRPSDDSMNINLRNRLEQEGIIFYLSYLRDIQNLLTNTNQLVKSNNIKQIIIQYLQIIKNF